MKLMWVCLHFGYELFALIIMLEIAICSTLSYPGNVFFAPLSFSLCRHSLLMADKVHDADVHKPLAKATLRLGSEVYSVNASKGILSEQLAAMKEESMSILKNFITKHNAPTDVPDDEAIESSSEDDTAAIKKAPERPKKRK